MRLLFCVVGLCAIWMLCACDDPGVAVQFDNILERETKSIHDTETILGPQDDTGHFFYPKTCRVNEGEQVEPCQGNQDLNKTMCLKSNCCFSSKDNDETTSCYTPVVDNVQLTLRFFVIGIVCLILLGCLPICCCILCQHRYANMQVSSIYFFFFYYWRFAFCQTVTCGFQSMGIVSQILFCRWGRQLGGIFEILAGTYYKRLLVFDLPRQEDHAIIT